jgi:hypothetical protein
MKTIDIDSPENKDLRKRIKAIKYQVSIMDKSSLEFLIRCNMLRSGAAVVTSCAMKLPPGITLRTLKTVARERSNRTTSSTGDFEAK